MKKIIGLGLILFDVIALIVIYIIIAKKGAYKGDLTGLLLDSWEVIGLFIAIFLIGLVLIKHN